MNPTNNEPAFHVEELPHYIIMRELKRRSSNNSNNIEDDSENKPNSTGDSDWYE